MYFVFCNRSDCHGLQIRAIRVTKKYRRFVSFLIILLISNLFLFMKKIIPLFALVFFGFAGYGQEAKFGLTAGYLNLQVTSYYEGTELSENSSGVFAGILGDFKLSETLHIEPALIYGHVKNLNMLFIPIHAKYYIGQSGINILAGPQGTFIIDEINPWVKRIGWDLSLGAGYDFTEELFFQLRYAHELTNRHDDKFISSTRGIDAGINSLFAGVGFKF